MSSETSKRDHVREILAVAGEKKLMTVARSARRRRLELRRLGRTASAAAEDEGAKRVRVRAAPTEGSSEEELSDSARVAPEPGTGVTTGCAACVSHGAVSVIGCRREMEDAVSVAPPFLAEKAASDGEEGFFAVYDGHGGSRVAEACRERMHVVLAEEVRLRRGEKWQSSATDEEADGARWKEAMAACFARVDGEVGAADDDDETSGDAGEQTVGSTAVVAVVGPRRVVVANCGDSRAVLSRGGVPVPLSSDHKVRDTHPSSKLLLTNKIMKNTR
jgi:protein phosphatase 2C